MGTSDKKEKMCMRDRVLAVMHGKLPDLLPFIDRIEIWYKGMQARGSMPRTYEGMSLNQVHEAFVENLLATVGINPIIIGVGDMVLDNNSIERVKYIADKIEAHDLEVSA